VFPGTGRLRRRPRLARRTAAARLAEGGRTGGGVDFPPMHPDFWHQRWSDQQIGFHQSTPTPLLLEHWPALGLPAGAQVFVPLAGKSLDMAWLAAQGHRVLGVELSPLAVAQFFAEHGLQP